MVFFVRKILLDTHSPLLYTNMDYALTEDSIAGKIESPASRRNDTWPIYVKR